MQTTTRTNQGGSVAVFLVVSAVFAMAVIVGMYAVQKRNDQIQSAPVAGQGTSSNTKEQTKTPSPDEADKRHADEKAAADKQAAQQKAAAEKKANDEKVAQQKAASDEAARQKQAQHDAANQQATIPQTSTATSHLPQTGPSDTTWQVVGGAVLLGAVIAYLKSYHYRFGSLL